MAGLCRLRLLTEDRNRRHSEWPVNILWQQTGFLSQILRFIRDVTCITSLPEIFPTRLLLMAKPSSPLCISVSLYLIYQYLVTSFTTLEQTPKQLNVSMHLEFFFWITRPFWLSLFNNRWPDPQLSHNLDDPCIRQKSCHLIQRLLSCVTVTICSDTLLKCIG